MTLTVSPETIIAVTESKISDAKRSLSKMKWISENWRAVLAELLATATLVFFGCMSCIPVVGLGISPALTISLTFGLTVMFCIQAYGHISGAHMNPVVTVASVIWGHTSVALATFYMIAQCSGSILGYWMLMSLSPGEFALDAICVTLPSSNLSLAQAFGVEVALASTLILVCCGIWDPVNQHKQDSLPVRFGLTVAAISLAGGHLTAASVNPARSLGPALLTGIWNAHWVYWTGPFVGGILAVLFYKTLLLTKPISKEH